MKPEAITNTLERNQTVFRGLLQNKTSEEYFWRPKVNKWNLLEITCHLLDEEQRDFKARIRYIFEKPDYPMPSINPEAWVVQHSYRSRDYNEVVAAFLNERQLSVAWLRERIDANWNQSIIHPKLGEMTAGLFLANWLAHDYLHIRQIVSLDYHFLKAKSGLDLNYAGNW